MNKIIYTIPIIPPSDNQYKGRKNVQDYRDDKKDWLSIVAAYCIPRPKVPIEKAIVELFYFFPDNIRRDPDNYSGKFILDGLVTCRILKDDCFGRIRLLLDAGLDRQNPRTQITITY